MHKQVGQQINLSLSLSLKINFYKSRMMVERGRDRKRSLSPMSQSLPLLWTNDQEIIKWQFHRVREGKGLYSLINIKLRAFLHRCGGMMVWKQLQKI